MHRWRISIRLPGRGHKAAAYMLAMLIWRANRGPFDDMLAEDLLSMAADDPAISGWNDLGIVRLRQHVIETLRRYV